MRLKSQIIYRSLSLDYLHCPESILCRIVHTKGCSPKRTWSLHHIDFSLSQIILTFSQLCNLQYPHKMLHITPEEITHTLNLFHAVEVLFQLIKDHLISGKTNLHREINKYVIGPQRPYTKPAVDLDICSVQCRCNHSAVG